MCSRGIQWSTRVLQDDRRTSVGSRDTRAILKTHKKPMFNAASMISALISSLRFSKSRSEMRGTPLLAAVVSVMLMLRTSDVE